MNVATRIYTNTVVFPNGFTGCEKFVTTKTVDSAYVPIASVGLHMPGLACSTYSSVVCRGAVVRKCAERLVPKPVPQSLTLERLSLCVDSQAIWYRGAIFGLPLVAGEVWTYITVLPAELTKLARVPGQPPVRVLPHMAERMKFAVSAWELCHYSPEIACTKSIVLGGCYKIQGKFIAARTNEITTT
jgi:hypothetical protein